MKPDPEKDTNFQRYTISEISALFAEKECSPVEITEYCIQKIESYNHKFNAFCHTDYTQARKKAQDAEARWLKNAPLSPIDGIPATIKDLFMVKGWPMRQGSLLLEPALSTEDSPSVAHLRNAGAVFLGTTTTPEFGHKGVTDSLVSGITRNPWDETKTPGGSSGGSAVAASLGMGFIHLGSDGGGSCRIPAGFTGVFGFKPTQNTIPIAPVTDFYDFATPGLLATHVRDVSTVLPILQQPHPHDSGHITTSQHIPQLQKPYKIGYIQNFPDIPLCPEIKQSLHNALPRLPSVSQIDTITPDFSTLEGVFGVHWTHSAYIMLQNFDKKAKQESLDPNLSAFEAHGATLTPDDILHAKTERNNIVQTCDELFQHHDFIVLPTLPLTAFEAGQPLPPHPETQEDWLHWSPFTYLANMAGLPAVSHPIGFNKLGLPIGLQILGPKFSDRDLLNFCADIENVFPIPRPAMKKNM